MQAKISSRGQLVIPQAIREQARLCPGDKVDIGFADGLVVMRKRLPLTLARVRRLLAAGRQLPEQTPQDEEAVAAAIRAVRARRRLPA